MNPSISPAKKRLLVAAVLLLGGGCTSSYVETGEERPRERRTVVTEEDIEEYPQASSVEELIARQVPGTQLFTRNDGRMTLTIMGLANSRTSGEPLFVIDGIPQPSGTGRIGLNPHDIARIEVLKEGGAMALYGFRGANGVVVITTKRGNEEDEPRTRTR